MKRPVFTDAILYVIYLSCGGGVIYSALLKNNMLEVRERHMKKRQSEEGTEGY